ncbi:MAG: AAA family ATPase, partial [Nitrospirae bacterium]
PIGSTKTEKADVRIIAATNRNLEHEIREGRFREDLYWRLSYCEVYLPALRERPEDIPLIAEHFIKKFNEQYNKNKTLTPKALQKLCAYHWPGNIRQLRKVVLQAFIWSEADEITHEDIQIPDFAEDVLTNLFPQGPYEDFKLEETIEKIRNYYYERAYQLAGGNQSQAAKLLGVSPQMVHQWVKKHRQGGRKFSA